MTCLIGLLAIAQHGCFVPPDSGMPCDGPPCDGSQSVLLFAEPPGFAAGDLVGIDVNPPFKKNACGVYSFFPRSADNALAGRRADGAPPDSLALLAFGVRPTADLRVAGVTRLGELFEAGLGAGEPDVLLDWSAVGLAWSNGGDRLAVVRRDTSRPRAEAHRLILLTPDLEEIASYTLDLPLSDPGDNLVHDRFAVSWNMDDSTIAVSTTVACTPEVSDCSGRVEACCVLTDVATGRSNSLRLYDVYFVGMDQIVATIPPKGNTPQQTRMMAKRVYAMRLVDGKLANRRFLQGPRFVIAGDPATGVFLTGDSPVTAVSSVSIPASLRTLDGSRNRFSAFFPSDISAKHGSGLRVSMLPLDSALPGLMASGFGPRDDGATGTNAADCPPVELQQPLPTAQQIHSLPNHGP